MTSLSAEVYRRFLEYVLADLAERRNQRGEGFLRSQRREETVSGQKQRVLLTGRHISYRGQDWFRGSDCSLRLTLAVMAGEKYHRTKTGKDRGANWSACLSVAAQILRPEPVQLHDYCDFVHGEKVPAQSPCEALRSRFMKGRRGPRRRIKLQPASARSQPLASIKPKVTEWRDARFAVLDARIAQDEARARVQKHKPEVLRFANTIRVQVDRFRRQYRRNNLNLDHEFDEWFGRWRYDCCRDNEWCAEVQTGYRRQLAICENGLGPCHHQTAMATLSLAQLLHTMGKFDEAVPVYRLALERWRVTTPVPEDRRAVALSSITAELGNCQAKRPPHPGLRRVLPGLNFNR